GQSNVKDLTDYLERQDFKVEILDEEEAHEKLTFAKTDLLIEPVGKSYRFHYDKNRTESVAAKVWTDDVLLRKNHPKAPRPEEVTEQRPGSRYIDFLIPGLMGLNLMGGGLWGVGFVLVDMRIRKLLKRLVATPMRPREFLFSILSSRLVFIVPEMLVLFLAGWLLLGVPMRGSYLTLLVVILVGGAAFAGLGLLLACRAEHTETVAGLINRIMLPMWMLSGTFFSSRRFPELLQPLIHALPVTQLNEALRGVMLEGAPLEADLLPLLIL